jgi:glycosyltransferase involved in cell wall biosynthesis
MKIMHIIIGLNIGGAELMLKRLLLSTPTMMRSSKTIISLTTLGKVGAELRDSGFAVYVLNSRGLLSIPRLLVMLIQLMRRHKPDIVQTWLYHADFFGGVAAKLAGVKHVIWDVRTTELNKRPYSTVIIRKICAVLSYIIPSKIVFAADASRKKHIKLGYSAKKMLVISNGFDLPFVPVTQEKKNDFRLQHGIHESHVVIGSLGRFNKLKAQDIFVKATGSLVDEFPNARFLMVGKNLDTSNSTLMSWINATGFPHHFILLGERIDVMECLSVMDVFCLHSHSEGFPNALGEAMAMRLPCISTDVGDARLLLADTGILVEKNNSEVLAEGLKQLLKLDPVERTLLGERAAKRVRTLFTLEQACAKFSTVYDELLKGKKR